MIVFLVLRRKVFVEVGFFGGGSKGERRVVFL